MEGQRGNWKKNDHSLLHRNNHAQLGLGGRSWSQRVEDIVDNWKSSLQIVFVGNLSPRITWKTLKEAFETYERLSRDTQSMHSRGIRRNPTLKRQFPWEIYNRRIDGWHIMVKVDEYGRNEWREADVKWRGLIYVAKEYTRTTSEMIDHTWKLWWVRLNQVLKGHHWPQSLVKEPGKIMEADRSTNTNPKDVKSKDK